MAITKIGAKGADGTDGTSPTPGSAGGDVLYSYTGSTTINMSLTGGPGGDGGSYTGQDSASGASGGAGGDATGLVDGNTFASAGGVNVVIVANGGTGGDCGTHTYGSGGNGGDGDAEISDNNLITSARVQNIIWTATANGGAAGKPGGPTGNATASITGNTIASGGPGFTNFTMAATGNLTDTSYHTYLPLAATIADNTLSGNLDGGITADAEQFEGTATISGNTIGLTLPSGAFGLTATGHHIVVDNNAITVAGQELEIQLNPIITPYSSATFEFSGNSLNGDGQSVLSFLTPSSVVDTVRIDLTDGSFLMNGQSNSISGFKDIYLNAPPQGGNGYAGGILIGDSQDNVFVMRGSQSIGSTIIEAVLYGEDGNDNLSGGGSDGIMIGGKGDDTLYNGIAAFSGERWQYTFTGNTATGPDGHDTLSDIWRMRFMGVTQIADFNDDGYSDLLFQNANGQVSISRMNGTTVLSHKNIGSAPSTYVTTVGTGDFDGDRSADILRQNPTTGELSILFTDGASITKSGVTIAAPAGGANWVVKAIADFNWAENPDVYLASGSSDILLQNKVTGVVQIDLLDTNLHIAGTASVASPSGTGWQVVAAGDFNGDGFADILWQNSTTNQIAIDLMNNTSVVQQTVMAGAGPKVQVIATGDFNGDNESDILWQNTTNGNVAIWFMDGSTVTSKAAIAQPLGSGWVVKGAEDINRDGKSDILWQNAAGQVYVALMSGSTVLSGSGLVTTPGAGWSLIATGGPSGG